MKVAVVGLGYVGAVLDALLKDPPHHLIDLTGRLGSEAEALPGYEGVSW